MELKEAIRKVREEKIVFDGSEGVKYFLFMGNHDKVYYVHGETINEDKKRIAILEDAIPNFLAKNWWKTDWKIWGGD